MSGFENYLVSLGRRKGIVGRRVTPPSTIARSIKKGLANNQEKGIRHASTSSHGEKEVAKDEGASATLRPK